MLDRAQMLGRLAEHEGEERDAVGQDAAQTNNGVDSSNPEALQPRYEGSPAETISACLLRCVYNPGYSTSTLQSSQATKPSLPSRANDNAVLLPTVVACRAFLATGVELPPDG